MTVVCCYILDGFNYL